MKRTIEIQIDSIHPDPKTEFWPEKKYAVCMSFAGTYRQLESITIHTKSETMQMYQLTEPEFTALLK